jgi:hypothetical protein
MVATFYGETGRAIEEFYFWDGRLFFVLRTQAFYDQPFGRVVRTEQNRFYFERGRLIQWLDAKNKPVALSGPAVRRRERDLLGDARTFATLLRRPAASPG